MREEKEHLQSKMNSWVTTLIHLKKCLEKDKGKQLELCRNKDNVRKEVFICHSKCIDFIVSSNPIVLKKYKAMASTSIASLKKSERDFELQNFLVENKCEKVQEGQKEH
jgi:hypothetical protein